MHSIGTAELSRIHDGRILCETVGLWIGLEDGRVVMVDAKTGEQRSFCCDLCHR